MRLRPSEWIRDEWYFTVRCHACGWQFPFAQVTEEPLTDDTIQITCIECGHTSNYSPGEFERVQAQ